MSDSKDTAKVVEEDPKETKDTAKVVEEDPKETWVLYTSGYSTDENGNKTPIQSRITSAEFRALGL